MKWAIEYTASLTIDASQFTYKDPSKVVLPSGKVIPLTDPSTRKLSTSSRRLIIEFLKLPPQNRRILLAIAYLNFGENQPECLFYDAALEDAGSSSKAFVPAFFHIEHDPKEKLSKEIEGDLEKEDPPIKPTWVPEAGIVEHNLSLRFSSSAGKVVTLHAEDKIKVRRLSLAEFSPVLPILELSKPEGKLKHVLAVAELDRGPKQNDSNPPPTLIARPSEIAARQLQALNRVVRIRQESIILLSGPPGSGKEVFANAIHHGALRSDRRCFKDLAVGGLSAAEIRRRLFGAGDGKGKIEPGLIAESKGGTLFLDEFDKVNEKEIYATLLRVLESKTYYPEGSIEKQRVEDVSWVLAGAFDSDGTRDRVPPDFFSRLNDHLKLGSPQQAPGYVRSLFLLFAYIEVVNWTGQTAEEVFRERASDEGVRGLAQKILVEDNFDPEENLIRPRTELINLCEEFVDLIKRAALWSGREDVSIRAIRQGAHAMIRHILEIAVTFGVNGVWEAVSKNKKEILQQADQVLRVVCRTA